MSLSEALTFVKNLPAVRGFPKPADDQFLNELLEKSAGVTVAAPSTPVHRRYFVGAKFLQQIKSVHTLKSADGAVFTGLAVPIASLFALQAAEDAALGLIIPPGYEVPSTDTGETGGSSGARPALLFGTSSTLVRSTP